MNSTTKPVMTNANALRVAKRIIRDKRYLVPTLIVTSRGEPLVIEIHEPANTPQARLHQFYAAGHKLAKSKQVISLEQIYFMTSAWMRVAEDHPRPNIPPSKDPNRKEILLITSLHISKGQTVTFIYEVIRESRGKFKKLIAQKEHPTIVENPTLRAFMAGLVEGRQQSQKM